MSPEITFAGRQSQGVREKQEDCYGFCALGSGPNAALLLALADGMGGHARGEVASALAVDTFLRRFDPRPAGVRSGMLDALQQANTEIGQETARRGGSFAEMGTTFVGVLFHRDELHWISVGDSPLFLCRGGALQRLNEEHVVQPVSTGSGDSAALTSALVGGKIPYIDAPEKALRLEPGDVVVCASDGINSIPLSSIVNKIMVHADLSAAELAEKLIQAVEAERKSSQDNLTITVIKHPAPAVES